MILLMSKVYWKEDTLEKSFLTTTERHVGDLGIEDYSVLSVTLGHSG